MWRGVVKNRGDTGTATKYSSLPRPNTAGVSDLAWPGFTYAVVRCTSETLQGGKSRAELPERT
jgi:hypothetical protein